MGAMGASRAMGQSDLRAEHEMETRQREANDQARYRRNDLP